MFNRQLLDILTSCSWTRGYSTGSSTSKRGYPAKASLRLSSGTAAGTLTWTHDRLQIVEGVDLRLVVWYGYKVRK
jgi:hypothetical protein